MSEVLSPYPKGWAQPPCGGNLFFSHYPRLMTMGDGLVIESFAFWLSSLFTTTVLYCRHWTNLPVNLTLHFTHKQDPKILELLLMGKQLTPNPKGAIYHFGAAWRFWHSALVSEGHGLMSRTRYCAKIREASPMTPNWTLCSPRLHLEILSHESPEQERWKGATLEDPNTHWKHVQRVKTHTLVI